VLCSSARRAQETWSALQSRIGARAEVSIERDLYLASGRALLIRMVAVGPTHDCVLLIAHNPGLQELAAVLDPDSARSLQLPAGAVAHLALRVDRWADLCAGAAELRERFDPQVRD
jgi:phosphohistidine phosphatase